MIPENFLKLANELSAIFRDQALDHSAEYGPLGTISVPNVLHVQFVIQTSEDCPFYINDWRFCKGGEPVCERIEIDETERIDALGIDWKALELHLLREIEKDHFTRGQKITKLYNETQRLANTNSRLHQLVKKSSVQS